jgi:hypothetical protein
MLFQVNNFVHLSGENGVPKSALEPGPIRKEVKQRLSRNLQLSAMSQRSDSWTRVSVVHSISSELKNH